MSFFSQDIDGGFRCRRCDEIKSRMWGDICNMCRHNDETEKLRTENAALKARLALAEKVIERLGRCGRVTAQFDFGTPEGIKVAAIYRWDEFDKVKEAIAAYDAESK